MLYFIKNILYIYYIYNMETLSGGGTPMTTAVLYGGPVCCFVILTAVVGSLVGVLTDQTNC
jgi:hypothetical protein